MRNLNLHEFKILGKSILKDFELSKENKNLNFYQWRFDLTIRAWRSYKGLYREYHCYYKKEAVIKGFNNYELAFEGNKYYGEQLNYTL